MRRRWIRLAFAAVAVVSAAGPRPAAADHGEEGSGHGTVAFPTTCASAVRPRFERAVAQLHSFGYDFARAGFEQVAAEDPACGMAWWGIAATWYHPVWAAPTPAELAAGRAAAEKGSAVGAGSEREREWIAAIGAFYADFEHADHGTRAGRYRDALAALAAKYPDDHEARIFEALLLLGTAPPRDPSHAQQKKAVEILTPFVAEHPEHPGVAHYLIHSLDYPDLANLALDAARRYARIAPASAHALHMPSHIFVRLGLWPEAIASNLDSAASAQRSRGLYADTAAFDQLHALDYLEYAYLQTGQDAEAKAVLARAAALWDPKAAPQFAAYYALAAIPVRYALERGDWKAAASLPDPLPPEALGRIAYVEAIPAYGRAIGAARSGDPARAAAEIDHLAQLQAKLAAAPPPGPYDWAGHVEATRLAAAGVLAQAQGDREEAIRLLTAAADLDARVGKHPVTPGTVLPPRELLADLLLEAGKPVEALAAYEAELVQTPNRLRALAGAARAAERAGLSDRARTLETMVASLTVPAAERPEVVRARAALRR